jgi:hypothetical protein
MRFITKSVIILIIGVIAVVLLNVLINMDAEPFLKQSDETAGSSVSASPTLLAPVQEQDANMVSEQNYNGLLFLLGLFGLIGIMAISINYTKRNK